MAVDDSSGLAVRAKDLAPKALTRARRPLAVSDWDRAPELVARLATLLLAAPQAPSGSVDKKFWC
jgi:hypothetical protein